MRYRVIPILLLTATLSGASLLGTPVVKAQDAAQQIDDVNSRLSQLSADLNAANARLARTKDLYKAGNVSVEAVDDAQSKVDSIARELQRAERDRQTVAGRAAFRQPVDIQLDHAKVQDLARVLSRVSGISVKVDKNVPSDASTMLTMDAQAVPFASVLEAVAQKTDLMIAPDGSGVILKKWPHLNGRVYRSATAPWSSDWIVPPTVNGANMPAGFNPFGGGGFGGNGEGAFFGGASPQPVLRGGGLGGGGFGGGAAPQDGFGGGGLGGGAAPQGGFPGGGGGFGGGAGPQGGFPGGGGGGFGGGNGPQGGLGGGGFGGPASPDGRFGPRPGADMAPGMGMPGGMPGMAPGLPFTMTNIADHIIAIAEPGVSDKGEPGVWLTAYMFDGSGFHRMAQGFHPFANRPRLGPPGTGGPPDPRGPGVPGSRPGKPSGTLRSPDSLAPGAQLTGPVPGGLAPGTPAVIPPAGGKTSADAPPVAGAGR
jgi:hypothetical protein